MKNIKTILLPTDFSTTANNAMRFALEFGGSTPHYILFHAYMPYESVFGGDVSAKENQAELEEVKAELEKRRLAMLAINPNANVSVVAEKGVESRCMLSFVKKQGVDLILMGTIGATGIKEKLLGSVTADIIAKSTCPVIAVPSTYRFKGVSKVLMPTGFRLQDIDAARFLFGFSVTKNADLHFIHVGKGKQPSAAENELMETFQKTVNTLIRNKKRYITWHVGDEAASQIAAISEKEKPDLLVMTTYKRKGFFDRIFHASTTRKVAHHTRIPLLVFPVGTDE
jgi:nucleotide-binding universal stress UspA family protein